jgi:hypothetical protein
VRQAITDEILAWNGYPPFLVSFEFCQKSKTKQIINTNALNILTSHVVIASPRGVAISFFMGLLRRLAPRNDNSFITFVLVN